MDERDLIGVFPNLTRDLKIYVTMPVTSSEAERRFAKPSIIKVAFPPSVWSCGSHPWFY